MAARGNRNDIVLATKFTTNYVKFPESGKKLIINYGGNSAKSLFVSVEDSLKKLQTNYIDLVRNFIISHFNTNLTGLTLALYPLVGPYDLHRRVDAISMTLLPWIAEEYETDEVSQSSTTLFNHGRCCTSGLAIRPPG